MALFDASSNEGILDLWLKLRRTMKPTQFRKLRFDAQDTPS